MSRGSRRVRAKGKTRFHARGLRRPTRPARLISLSCAQPWPHSTPVPPIPLLSLPGRAAPPVGALDLISRARVGLERGPRGRAARTGSAAVAATGPRRAAGPGLRLACVREGKGKGKGKGKGGGQRDLDVDPWPGVLWGRGGGPRCRAVGRIASIADSPGPRSTRPSPSRRAHVSARQGQLSPRGRHARRGKHVCSSLRSKRIRS